MSDVTGTKSTIELLQEAQEREKDRLKPLIDVPLDIAIRVGEMRMRIRDILSLCPGAVIEVDKAAGEHVDILINNTLIGHGELVVTQNEKYGCRVIDIVSQSERIEAQSGKNNR